jgi:hypothetical protein
MPTGTIVWSLVARPRRDGVDVTWQPASATTSAAPPTSAVDEAWLCKEAGAAAAKAGRLLRADPYVAGSVCSIAWRKGWRTARTPGPSASKSVPARPLVRTSRNRKRDAEQTARPAPQP